MRALKAAVIVMGVLIVAGVAVIVVTIVRRLSSPSASPTPSTQAVVPSTLLHEPLGTHIASVAASPDRLALTLQGGGPDRVVVIDTRSGKIVARAELAP